MKLKQRENKLSYHVVLRQNVCAKIEIKLMQKKLCQTDRPTVVQN